jgi:predicted SAM-dependent methyltransferase
MNIDAAFVREGMREFQYGTDDKGAHNMMLTFGDNTTLPFAAESVTLIYSEHMLEHLPAHTGARVLREAYRVLAPGGVLRIATPDLETYMCG